MKHLGSIFLAGADQGRSKRIQRYQRGRQKSLGRKTDKTMAKKLKLKTNIEHTTLHLKLKRWSNMNPSKTKVSSDAPEG